MFGSRFANLIVWTTEAPTTLVNLHGRLDAKGLGDQF